MDHVTPNTHFLNTISGDPGGSAVKESSCNAGDAQEIQIRFLGQEDSLEKEMATHSSMPAWKIPWTEEPSGRQSIGSQRIRHGLATKQ